MTFESQYPAFFLHTGQSDLCLDQGGAPPTLPSYIPTVICPIAVMGRPFIGMIQLIGS